MVTVEFQGVANYVKPQLTAPVLRTQPTAVGLEGRQGSAEVPVTGAANAIPASALLLYLQLLGRQSQLRQGDRSSADHGGARVGERFLMRGACRGHDNREYGRGNREDPPP